MKYLKNLFFVGLAIAWSIIFLHSYDFSSQIFDWVYAGKKFGKLSWILLIYTIFISLAFKLTKFKIFGIFLPLRKYTGIWAFIFAFVHVFCASVARGLFESFDVFSTFISNDFSMIFGVIAFFAMFPAFVTSTVWAMKKLGAKFWKNIQRLTHVAFVFTALHVALIQYFTGNEIENGPLVLLGLYLLGYGYLFFKK